MTAKILLFPLLSRGVTLGQDDDNPLCAGCERLVAPSESEWLCSWCGEIAHAGCLTTISRGELVCKECLSACEVADLEADLD